VVFRREGGGVFRGLIIIKIIIYWGRKEEFRLEMGIYQSTIS